MLDYLKTLFENRYASGTILAFIGTLIGVIVTKLSSKLALVSYSVSTAKLGETLSNDIHGKIEVRHRDQPLPNFYFSRVKIQNCSTKDLENIRIMFYVADGVRILSDFIRYDSEVRRIPYSDDYSAITNDPENPLFFVRREYSVPVLNRGQSIVLELTLTHKPAVDSPHIYASMVHKGARLVERPYTIEFLGVSIRRTLPWAIILGVLLYVAVSLLSINPWIGGGIMLFYGFFAQPLCAEFLKGIDRISRGIGILPPAS